MTVAQIHANAGKFERRVRIGNAGEYIAAIFVILAMGEMALTGGFGLHLHPGPSPFVHDWWVRVGARPRRGGDLIVVWQLRQRASLRAPLASSESLVDAYRAALVRRRDALRSIGVWYLGPLLPGLVVLMTGLFLHAPPNPSFARVAHFIDFLVSLLFAAMFALVWLINQRGADRLQRQIDEL